MDNDRLVFAIVVSTVLMLAMLGFLGFLLVLNSSRRARHRAQLAEIELQHQQEVMDAGREAMKQTLSDLGRELHDNLGQTLAVARMGLETELKERPGHSRLTVVHEAVARTESEMRRFSHSLMTDLWNERSLAEAISLDGERIQRVSRVRVTVELEDGLPEPKPDIKTVLYRVFQEVVTNALKHSGAAELHITLSGKDELVIVVADNGAGFDPATTRSNGGLHGIHRRCALVGYAAVCTSAPGRGCTWRIAPRTGMQA